MKYVRFFQKIILFYACLLLTACSFVTPSALNKQRSDYNEAVAHSDDGQLLLNIVRLHYLDSPVFLQINSITSQNSLQSTAALNYAFYMAPNGGGSNTVTPGMTYTISPTISYTPLQGAQFTQNMLSPVSLLSVYYLANAGWSIDKVFRLTLQNIGDNYNRGGYINTGRPETDKKYPQFLRVCQILTHLQGKNDVDFYYDANSQTGLQLFIVNFHANVLQSKEVVELRKLVNLPPTANNILFTTDYSLQAPNVVPIKTRSVMAIMSYLADFVQVPGEKTHFIAVPGYQPILHVGVSTSKISPPPSSMVHYRDYYFYIPDSDTESKRILILLRNLYELSAGLPGGTSGVVLSLPVSSK